MKLTSKAFGNNGEYQNTYEVKLADRNGKYYVEARHYHNGEYINAGATGAKFTLGEALKKCHQACNDIEVLPA